MNFDDKMYIEPDVRRFFEYEQAQAIRQRGYVPDRDRYEYSSERVFLELLAGIPRGDPQVEADLDMTLRLTRSIGPFQNPNYLYFLVKYNREVLDAARAMGVADDSWVPFASTTVGHRNAVTTVLRRSRRYATLYNDGVFSLAELVGRQIAFAWSEILRVLNNFQSVAAAARHVLSPTAEIVRSIVGTLVTYAASNDARPAEASIPREFLAADSFAANLRGSYVRFVVAHELGHVYLRHLERAAVEQMKAEAATLSFDWACELDADAFAAKVSVDCLMSQADAFNTCIAVEAAPMIDVLVASASDYLEYGGIRKVEDSSGSHPPADRRFQNVRDAIDSHIAAKHPAVDVQDVHLAHGVIELVAWALLPPLRDECLRVRRLDEPQL